MRLLVTHNILCSLINDSWKSHLLFLCNIHGQYSKLLCIDGYSVTLLCSALCVFREQIETTGVLGLATAQAFSKMLLAWLRFQVHLSHRVLCNSVFIPFLTS